MVFVEEENGQGKAAEKPAGTGAGGTVQERKKARKAESRQANWVKENKIGIVLAVVLLAVAGYAVSNLLKGPPEVEINGQPENGGTAELPIPKMFLVYTRDCFACEGGNSIELLLRKNKINFAAQEVPASSETAKTFIEGIGLEKLPALIIDGSTVSDALVIESDENFQISSGSIGFRSLLELLVKKYPSEATYDKASDVFVLYELSLDGKAHVDYLLNTEECPPASPETLARVDIFVDPYSANYIKAKETIDLFREQYQGRIEFNYRYRPFDASRKIFPAEMPWGNIENLARYLACADNAGFLVEAENAFYARYCALNDNNVLEPFEMQNCSDSNHFGFPILGDEADLISKLDLNYDRQEFGECLEQLPEQFAADAAFAEQLLVYRVPTAVVNCKFSTHALGLAKALCKARPDIDICDEATIPELTEEVLCRLNPELEQCRN